MSVSFLIKPLRVYLDERFTMVRSEELLCALIAFGRSTLQDFVARSRDLNDASTYLQAELNLELARVTSFKTTDLVTFEKKAASQYQPNQAANCNHQK